MSRIEGRSEGEPMLGRSILISLAAVVCTAAISAWIYDGESPGTGEDKVDISVKAVGTLVGAASGRLRQAPVIEHAVITMDLARGGSVPKAFMSASGIRNPWGGNVVVQVFPANAWGSGTPETINIVLETLPESDCARLVQGLSRVSPARILRINLEPSGKVHGMFPVSGDSGCVSGSNNIGYTVLAK